eukprot:TRINITY_DN32474_c0_g1_i1.p1 TRINITY_DN32474_c0_g1~~TRINITY_DN32474_c0_g1_i1.p1  ORF type:complete len:313 (+),score=165.17 TRINITY_DN32474_c0_g1_i1:45-983(+)
MAFVMAAARGCARVVCRGGMARGWGAAPARAPRAAWAPVRWCSRSSAAASEGSSSEGFFDSVDEQMFQSFKSTQVNLVRDADGRKVSIIPMQHVASKAFYKSVLKELATDKYFLVLTEGVVDDAEHLQKEDAMQVQIASDAGFRAELIEKVQANQHYTKQEEEGLYTQSGVPYPPPAALDLVNQELYFSPRLLYTVPLKVKNSDVTRERILSIEEEEERNFFVKHGRTDHCGKVLREYLAQPLQDYPDCPGADTIAVCWGLIHCQALVEDLLTRGFSVESEETREFGWTEEFYNEVRNNWDKMGRSYDGIIN